MIIRVDQFNYTVPKVSPKSLEPSQAQVAINCNLESGHLMPIGGLTHVINITKPGAIKSIYKMGGHWIVWDKDIDVVKAQIVDSDHMIFFTGDGYPKVTNKTLATGDTGHYPQTVRRLGITPPANTLTVEPQGTGNGMFIPMLMNLVLSRNRLKYRLFLS